MKGLSHWFVITLLFGTVFSYVANARAATPELKVIATFTTGGAGRWDYPTVDADARRLYVAGNPYSSDRPRQAHRSAT